jgi:hypothetical protein
MDITTLIGHIIITIVSVHIGLIIIITTMGGDMKKFLITFLIGIFSLGSLILMADIQLGRQGRPYSFYYPYNYQYYTPYPHRTAVHSKACHWVLTNGIYVYQCD